MDAQQLQEFERQSERVGRVLKTLGNGVRLRILCKLVEYGEINVSALAREVGLSASALSQHLSRLRGENLVTTRRDSQTIWYRVAGGDTRELMRSLYGIYCVKEHSL